MSAARVVLWRHGQTDWNAEDRFQGQTDIGLNDTGRDQAKRAADKLAEHLGGDQVTVVSSDLSRARDTADELAARLNVQVQLDPRLREIYARDWEGLTRPEMEAGWPDDYARWLAGDPDVLQGGGESRRQAASRAAEAIRAHDAALTGGTLVCVAHGGCLRGAVFTLLGLDDAWPWAAFEGLRNAHWTELRNTTRGWRLGTYNAG